MNNRRKFTGAIIFSIAPMIGLVYAFLGIHLWLIVLNCVIIFLFGVFGYFLGSVLDKEAEFKKIR